MKVKELTELLRIQVPIEFRIDNDAYCNCESGGLMTEQLGDYEIEDWFVFIDERRICINLKPLIEAEEAKKDAKR